MSRRLRFVNRPFFLSFLRIRASILLPPLFINSTGPASLVSKQLKFCLGYTIENANQPNYCSNSTWKDLLEDCLECAETYDIWKDYGDGVSGVAKACGITPKPSPASSTGGGGSTTAGPTGSSATSNPSTTTGSAPGSSSTGSGSSASGSSGATTTPAPSTTGDASGSGVSQSLAFMLSP